jgi:hypothetical protein
VLAPTLLSIAVTAAYVGMRLAVHVYFYGRTQLGRFRLWVLRTSLFVFVVELVVSTCLGFALGAVAGASFLAVSGVYSLGLPTLRTRRRLSAACKGLLRAETAEASLKTLEAELALRRARLERPYWPDENYSRYATVALSLARHMAEARLTGPAVRALEQVDPARLGWLVRAQRAQMLAAYLIANGERDRARKELAQIPRPVPEPGWEEGVAALDALLLALEGDAVEAEARSRRAIARVTLPAQLGAWQIVLAHSLAAQGLNDEATELLTKVRLALGGAALARVARHRGPASAIAETLQARTGAPYR